MEDDLTIKAVKMALDGLSLREEIIGHNIANADTPGFKARTVTFAKQLRQALDKNETGELHLKRTLRGHIDPDGASGPLPQVISRTNSTLRIDGNSVDLDLEMMQLAETNIQYQALTQLISRKMALLKMLVSR